jgi:hypothetical protein
MTRNEAEIQFFSDLCKVSERAVWGPCDPDDGMIQTSSEARVFAAEVETDVLPQWADLRADGHEDASIDSLVYGIRRSFDLTVNRARPIAIAAGHTNHPLVPTELHLQQQQGPGQPATPPHEQRPHTGVGGVRT